MPGCSSTKAGPSRYRATLAIRCTRSGSCGTTILRPARALEGPRKRWWPTDAAPPNERRPWSGGSLRVEHPPLMADLDLARLRPGLQCRLALGAVRPADPHLRRPAAETHHLDRAIEGPIP